MKIEGFEAFTIVEFAKLYNLTYPDVEKFIYRGDIDTLIYKRKRYVVLTPRTIEYAKKNLLRS